MKSVVRFSQDVGDMLLLFDVCILAMEMTAGYMYCAYFTLLLLLRPISLTICFTGIQMKDLRVSHLLGFMFE